ncbi:MAG: M28 family peptidase [Spirochaetia bacterium]|nr:M28 family peptidase [Spirochaetia bacterium]
MKANISHARVARVRPVLIMALSLGIVSAACQRTTPPITQDDLTYYVGKLASSEFAGREAGTESGRKTVEFVEKQYKAMGLLPLFGDSFREEFPFPAGVQPGAKNTLTWSVEAPDGSKSERKAVPVPLPLSAPGQASGDLVFLGFCLNDPKWNDYTGHNVKGKVILCLRHGPGGKENKEFGGKLTFEAKFDTAAKAGVAGVIFLGGNGAAVATGDLGLRKKPGPPAVFMEPKEFFEAIPALKQEEEVMRAQKPGTLVGRSLGKITLETDYSEQQRTGFNVGARLRKPNPNARVIIVGAHLDHLGRGSFSSLRGPGAIHPGADDNASGTAVTLEVAGEMMDEILHGKSSLPADADVIFINFDAEERGTYGSSAYVKSKFFPPGNVIAMINLDMVGRLRKPQGLNVQGADTAGPAWKQIMDTSFKKAAFPEGIPIQFIAGGRGPSDHTAFYERQVPVAFLYTGAHKEYHTPDYKAGTLNVSGMVPIARMVKEMALEASAVPTLGYRRAAKEPDQSIFEFRVRLGIVPGGYGMGTDGLEVGGVLDDAPVAKTGIKTGDKIVELGGKKIGDIHDLMNFLNEASLQTKYKIVFVRDGKRIESETELIPAK